MGNHQILFRTILGLATIRDHDDRLTIIVPPTTLPLDIPLSIAFAADPDPDLVIIVSPPPPIALPVEPDPMLAVADPEPPGVTALAVTFS